MPRRSTIASLQASITRLTPEQQQQIYDWLGKQLQENSASAIDSTQSGIETRNYQGKPYVLQKRRCSRTDCACMEGEMSEVRHGPYWYAYWNEGGKTQNYYVGKCPPWLKESSQK